MWTITSRGVTRSLLEEKRKHRNSVSPISHDHLVSSEGTMQSEETTDRAINFGISSHRHIVSQEALSSRPSDESGSEQDNSRKTGSVRHQLKLTRQYKQDVVSVSQAHLQES